MLHAKNCLLNDAFSEVFLTASKPSERSITAAKTREKEKKERRKKIPKIEKPKDVGHFLIQKLSQNSDFCTCPSHNALKRDAGGKKAKLLSCKRIFDRIKGNLGDIKPKNHQNVQKNALFAKSSRSQWVNLHTSLHGKHSFTNERIFFTFWSCKNSITTLISTFFISFVLFPQFFGDQQVRNSC